MHIILTVVENIILLLVLYFVIGWLWMLGEKLMYGQITPRLLDDIICLLFAVSIYLNIKDLL